MGTASLGPPILPIYKHLGSSQSLWVLLGKVHIVLKKDIENFTKSKNLDVKLDETQVSGFGAETHMVDSP